MKLTLKRKKKNILDIVRLKTVILILIVFWEKGHAQTSQVRVWPLKTPFTPIRPMKSDTYNFYTDHQRKSP